MTLTLTTQEQRDALDIAEIFAELTEQEYNPELERGIEEMILTTEREN